MPADNDAATAINAVGLKLPPFWQTDARAWFITVESQFVVRNITTDDTKYHHIVSALDSDTARQVISLISSPPATDKYEALKNKLLDIFELSARQKKLRLIGLDGLGDRKPTELLRYMQSLHEAPKGDDLFMVMFLQQLQATARTILAGRDFNDIEVLAKAADEVVAEHRSADHVHALRAAEGKGTGYKKDKYSSGKPTNSGSEKGLCFYHGKFGKEARACKPPCSWSGNAMASN